MKFIDNNGVVHSSILKTTFNNLKIYLYNMINGESEKSPEIENVNVSSTISNDENLKIEIDYEAEKVYLKDPNGVIQKEFPLDQRLTNPLDGIKIISEINNIEEDTPVG